MSDKDFISDEEIDLMFEEKEEEKELQKRWIDKFQDQWTLRGSDVDSKVVCSLMTCSCGAVLSMEYVIRDVKIDYEHNIIDVPNTVNIFCPMCGNMIRIVADRMVKLNVDYNPYTYGINKCVYGQHTHQHTHQYYTTGSDYNTTGYGYSTTGGNVSGFWS